MVGPGTGERDLGPRRLAPGPGWRDPDRGTRPGPEMVGLGTNGRDPGPRRLAPGPGRRDPGPGMFPGHRA
ncbi:hypothetical protein E2562_017920 [Oryza meyeriana var. granulata]|uniref:Uncharacterized protein n=1 Tax=Oryza meyeriana var. granulata TaxID=110450 RepID=A0A6G1CQV1_9ORYZ|nr:hypothetical protein E2562_017920 [Oryza meyeriana var. granulata]